MNPGQRDGRGNSMADQLDELNTELREANRALLKASAAHSAAQVNQERAAQRYKRMALWIRADELRRELEYTEDEAAKITL